VTQTSQSTECLAWFPRGTMLLMPDAGTGQALITLATRLSAPGICGGQSRLSESRKALALLKTNTSRKRRRSFCEGKDAISARSKGKLSREPLLGYQNRMFCDVALGASSINSKRKEAFE